MKVAQEPVKIAEPVKATAPVPLLLRKKASRWVPVLPKVAPVVHQHDTSLPPKLPLAEWIESV